VNSPKRLLVVEDDSVTRRLLQQILQQAGFEVTTANDASSALNFLQQQGLPHLILLDLGLPGMGGFELSERIKRMGDVPIIILSGNNEEESKVYGIQQFADDYITKPFNIKEVVARIQRVLSRIPDYSYAQGRVVEVDAHLSIDFANKRIILDGNETTLTPTETNLLHILYRQKGHIVSPDTLIARVWPGGEVYEETLRVHMHRLRKKLQLASYLQTERGIGYSFIIPDDYAAQNDQISEDDGS